MKNGIGQWIAILGLALAMFTAIQSSGKETGELKANCGNVNEKIDNLESRIDRRLGIIEAYILNDGRCRK